VPLQLSAVQASPSSQLPHAWQTPAPAAANVPAGQAVQALAPAVA
jgi:hypothetical protein